MHWTESEIQALKAQEAKDVAIELLKKLEATNKGPITPGEVQVKELDFELRLREAEIEDNRRRESHERKLKELELQIEQERSRYAEAESQANLVRESFHDVVSRVEQAGESLATQLERATRESNLKIEQLESSYTQKKEELSTAIVELEKQRDELQDEIAAVTALRDEAVALEGLRTEIVELEKEARTKYAHTEEQVAAAEFELTRKTGELQRKQQLELAEMEAEHQKSVLQHNQRTAEAILKSRGMRAISESEWQRVQDELESLRERSDNDAAQIKAAGRDELKREFNITRDEPIDVTELFYREQTTRQNVDRLQSQIDRFEAEVQRMREHIEHEPGRISAAVEASKTPVQNYIEQTGKR